MAWLDDAIVLLRVLTGDDNSPYNYCDDRLSNMIIGSAKMVLFELSFDANYSVDINTLSVTPDPSSDNFFIPLVCLFAAVKIANSEYRQFSLASVNITDGPSAIDMSGQSAAFLQRMKALQADWAAAKLQYSLGNAIGAGSVLSGLRSVYSNCYSNGYFNANSYYNSNYNYEFHY